MPSVHSSHSLLVELESKDHASQADIRRLGKGAGIALVGRIGGRALLLLNQVILARLLGPADFGLYALGWTVLQMGSLIAPLGLHQGVIRFGSQYWRKDDGRFHAVLRVTLLLAVLIGFIAGIALFVSAPWLANYVFKKPALKPVFRGFAVALGLACVLKISAAATRITQRTIFSVLAEDFFPPTVQLVFVLWFVVLRDLSVKRAIFSAVLGFVFATGLIVFFVHNLFGIEIRKVSPATFSVRELFAFSLPVFVAGNVSMLSIRLDRFLVGYFLPSSEVGIYLAASQPAMLSAIILGSFNAIFAPMIARFYQERELGRLGELFKVSTKWGLYISLPLFLVLVAAPREVMYVMFGEHYISGAKSLLIMASAQMFNTATGAVGFLLIMSGYQLRWLYLSILALITNVGLGLLLIPRWGINGAAFSVAASIVLLYGGGLVLVRQLLSLWPYDARYKKLVLATGIALGVFLCSKIWLIQEGNWHWLRLGAAALLSVFVFASVVLFKADRDDVELLRAFSNKVVAVFGTLNKR